MEIETVSSTNEESKETSEPAAQQVEEVDTSRHQLLNRLFKLLNNDSAEELNPVLAGYFSKVIGMLLKKKPNQMVSYLFRHPQAEARMLQLIEHIEAPSICEILSQILQTEEQNNFADELLDRMSDLKKVAAEKLVEKLFSTGSEAVGTVLIDLLQSQKLFAVIAQISTIQRLSEKAFSGESKRQRMIAKCLLEKILGKANEKRSHSANPYVDDDDDLIINQDSEDEDSLLELDSATLDEISCLLPKI